MSENSREGESTAGRAKIATIMTVSSSILCQDLQNADQQLESGVSWNWSFVSFCHVVGSFQVIARVHDISDEILPLFVKSINSHELF